MNRWGNIWGDVGPITRLHMGVYSDAPSFLEDFDAFLREHARESGLGLDHEFTAALVGNAERLGVPRQELVQRYTATLHEPALAMARTKKLPLPFLRTVNALGGEIPDYVRSAFSGSTLDAVVHVLSLPQYMREGNGLAEAVECLSYFDYGGEDAKRRDAALVGAAQLEIGDYLNGNSVSSGQLVQAVRIVAQKTVPDPATIDALVERSLFIMARGAIEFGADVLWPFNVTTHEDKIYNALARAVFSPHYDHPSLWSSISALILKLNETAEMPPHIATVIRSGVRQYATGQYAADVSQGIADVESLLSPRAGMASAADDERSRALLESITAEQLPHARANFLPTRPITAYRIIFGQLGDNLSAVVGKAVQTILYQGDMESAYTLALSAAGRSESIEPAPFREALSQQRNRILAARDSTPSQRLYALREYVPSLTIFETAFSGRLDYGLAEEITATARAVTAPNARQGLLQLQYLGILADKWKSAKGTGASHAITDQALKTSLEEAFQEGLAALEAFDEQRMSRNLKRSIRYDIQQAMKAFGYAAMSAAMPSTIPATVQRGAHPIGTQADAPKPQPPPIIVYVGNKRIPAGSEQQYVADVMSGLEGKLKTPPEPTQKSVADGGTSMTLYGLVVAREDAGAVLTHPALQSAVRAVGVHMHSISGDNPLPDLKLEVLRVDRVDGFSVVYQRGWNTLAVYQLNGLAQMLTGAKQAAQPGAKQPVRGYQSARR